LQVFIFNPDVTAVFKIILCIAMTTDYVLYRVIKNIQGRML